MNKKSMATASLVLSIISIIPLIVGPDSLNGQMIFAIIGVVFAIVAIILGFIGKSEKKGMAIAGIVIGIITTVLLCLAIVGFNAMKDVTDCVDQGNGNSMCKLYGEDIEVPTSFLTEEQKKK